MGSPTTTSERLDVLEQAFRDLRAGGVPLEDTPDTVGRLAHLRKLIADFEKSLLTEAEPDIRGSGYRTKATSQGNTLTVNGDGVLMAMADKTGSLVTAIREATAEGALKMNWTFTKTQKMLEKYGVEYAVAPREVTDGDTALLGRFRKPDKIVVEAIEGD